MVFLSLAARYFDCMCSTPKSPAGPLIGSEVAAAKLELGAARAAPEVQETKRPPYKGNGRWQGPVGFC